MFARHLHSVIALSLFAAAASARADTLYECVEANGTKRFTNVQAEAKGCKVLSVMPSSGPSPAAPATPAAPAATRPQAKAQVASPSQFPRVDREMQRQRDNDRLRILENELGTEERLLAQAKKELSEQESVRLGTEKNYQRVLERLEPFQRKVRQHEDNVASLRREISKVR